MQQRLPFNELVQNVYQQWLTADLTDLETPVLPNCLPKANRFVLNGNYSIQVILIVRYYCWVLLPSVLQLSSDEFNF